MAKQRAFQRTDRINQQLLELLSSMILRDVRDPRVQQVQVTAVEAAPDLRHAKVFYILLEDRTPQPEVQQGLERVAGFLRKQLGERLSMKHIPQLVFTYDESIERGRRMEALLGEILPADEGSSEEE